MTGLGGDIITIFTIITNIKIFKGQSFSLESYKVITFTIKCIKKVSRKNRLITLEDSLKLVLIYHLNQFTKLYIPLSIY